MAGAVNSTILAMMNEPSEGATLTWINIAIGFTFILLNVGLSTAFRLGLGTSLLIAAVRCTGQLAAVATVLHQVFEHRNPWTVALVAFVLNLLGTIEVVVNKSSRTFKNMFIAVLVVMLGSTIPVSIIGASFAMSVTPFWEPIQYIPIVGMLCGSAIAGVVMTVNYLLKELQESKDKVEIILAFGGSRLEACRPLAISALKIALTQPINQMSVIGIIAIPGMMTGAILGGASVQQAARLQMIIMFMITASTTLASVLTAGAVIAVTLDSQHRIRGDRIFKKGKSWFMLIPEWTAGQWGKVKHFKIEVMSPRTKMMELKSTLGAWKSAKRRAKEENEGSEDQEMLLRNVA
jgi:uncharacterized protein (TIGR00245 family)